MQYQPDSSVLPTEPWNDVYLSNRDIAYRVPINFVTHPGVYITAACFGNRTYSAVAVEKCMSNLLAAQYRRFVLDVYWHPGTRLFGLCPVELPSTAGQTTVILPTSAVTTAHISTVQLSRSSTRIEEGRRQATSATSSSSANATALATSTSSSMQIPVATSVTSSGETLFSLGSYQCSQNLDIHNFNPLILGYLQNTSDTLNARLLWLEFNLHAAASAYAPDDPAQAPPNSTLPSEDQLLGHSMNSTMQAYIYTPSDLASDRSDLNESWYHSLSSYYPDPGYFTTQRQADGILSTANGWPNEAYIQLMKVQRVLLGWGAIDPQMADYNFSGDSGMVFPEGYLSEPRPIQADGAGQVTSGCFFDSSVTTASQPNSSWALSSLSQNGTLSALVNNLTACGISPILNETLDNASADENATSYISFPRSAIWNWAAGEPRNISVSGFDNDHPQSKFRCAIMDISSAYAGHWRVEDCPNQYRAACRVDNGPYEWVLSSNQVSFYDAPFSCPNDAIFSSPRTGLENQYLYNHVLSGPVPIDTDDEARGIWINLNWLDVATCWVTTGPNGTCPYFVNESAEQSRQILVPTIGAIIVFVLTALTIFVKCNANRRNSRTRRRGDGGWDYEGVPS